MKNLAKSLATVAFTLLATPLAAVSGFGRWVNVFVMGSHLMALTPGIWGDYVRSGYYRLTLRSCPFQCRISFGVLFSHPDAVIGENVYIGPYSIMGRVRIGQATQIASQVQILSGANQHIRDAEGRIQGSGQGKFTPISIGHDCWIGAGAIVMASVGDNATIGAGSIVTKSVPDGVVAVGNPARVLAPGSSEPLRT